MQSTLAIGRTAEKRKPASQHRHSATPRSIGILGGTGPLVTAKLHAKLLSIAHKHYGAVQDDDYPSVLVINRPIPGFDEKGNDSLGFAATYIEKGIAELAALGATLVLLPCNTLHSYLQNITLPKSVTLIHLPDVAVAAASLRTTGPLAALTSRAAADAKLYAHSATQRGLALLDVPEQEQRLLDTSIAMVLRGDTARATALLHATQMRLYHAYGVRHTIRACTELSMLPSLRRNETDALYEAAHRALQLSYEPKEALCA